MYSLIVVEKSKDPWGDYVEKLGTYNPHDKSASFNVDRINYWLGVGAQPTPTIHNLLVAQGIIKKDKVRAGKSQPGKKRQAKLEAASKAKEEAEVKTEAPAAAEKVVEPATEAVAESVPAEASVEPEKTAGEDKIEDQQ